jgi:RNA polymerase sigma-70 factor (ECF subfamily)
MDANNDKKRQEILTSAHHDFEKKLAIYAFFKTHNHATSQDLVQDTFIKTWNYLVKGGDIVTMKAFLYHILNNLIVDEYRKKKTSSLDVLLEKGYEPGVDDSNRLFDFIDGKALILLIQKLPPKYQKVMNMKYVQLLSLEEMSLILVKSKNTVAVNAHRGLEKLKQLYEESIGIKIKER